MFAYINTLRNFTPRLKLLAIVEVGVTKSLKNKESLLFYDFD